MTEIDIPREKPFTYLHYDPDIFQIEVPVDSKNEKIRSILIETLHLDANVTKSVIFFSIPPLRVPDSDDEVDKYEYEDEDEDEDVEVERNKEAWTVPVFLKSDNAVKRTYVSVEDYFKLQSTVIWDHPEYGKLAERVTMAPKLEDAAPYNVFFNVQTERPETENQLYSLNFEDLLCPSLGKLKSSLHFMYMADPWWILSKFASRRLHKKPITIVHGCRSFPWPADEVLKELYPNLNYFYFPMKEGSPGLHHSKLSIFLYEDDSVRVYVGSANLFSGDWTSSNNCMWISPKCAKLPKSSVTTCGDSPTGFKSALQNYMAIYRKFNIPGLQPWYHVIRNIDFSDVKVKLLYNKPGVHVPVKNLKGCIVYNLGYALSQDCVIPAPKEEHNNWPVVVQTMSIGKIGATPHEWLTTHFLKSLQSNIDCPYKPEDRTPSDVKFNVVFASKKDCPDLGSTYEDGLRDMQSWMHPHFCHLKADNTGRSGTFTHAKSYCRISPCSRKMVYFFLSSANFSRSGWGSQPRNSKVFIRSYEMGVLFLPKYFGEDYFEVLQSSENRNRRLFPLLYDLPLTPYGPDDVPFGHETPVNETTSELSELQVNDAETPTAESS